MAHAGVGSVSFTTCLLLNDILKVKPTSIPVQGTGPSMNALIGSQIDYMCDQIVNAVPQVQGGTIKAYAIGTEERNPSLPNVPTSKEAGLPEFQALAWNALIRPRARRSRSRTSFRRRSIRRSTTSPPASGFLISAAIFRARIGAAGRA
jgi:tripartite-type tricarboxylate transporter receptor subunit TctC